MKYVWTVYCMISISVSALANTLPFSIPTKDGLSHISGQVDIPQCGQVIYPSVLIVGGTGLFSRNGYFGRSGTERDFLFLDLSKKLNAKCIAAIRFDFRGVSCDLTDKSKIESCIDQKVRASVTDETILDDIQSVYDFVKLQSFLDSTKMYLFGHSEGTLNISRLVKRASVQPAGILFMGGITESAKSILRWQIVDRPVVWAFEMDTNKDDTLTNDEIRLGFSTSNFNGAISVESILSPTGSWTRDTLTVEFNSIYREVSNSALAKDDGAPYILNGVVFSTYKWWKRWFLDNTSVLENLQSFQGPIKYHNGDHDSQAPGIREKAFLDSTLIKMNSEPLFEVHPGLGHGLGKNSLYGPMDEAIAEKMVSEISEWSLR